MSWPSSHRKHYALLWGVLLLVLGAYLVAQLGNRNTFDTDIFSLLPKEEQSEVVRQANQAMMQGLGREIIVLVEGESAQSAAKTSLIYQHALKGSRNITVANAGSNHSAEQLLFILSTHRLGLLTYQQQAMLGANNIGPIQRELTKRLYGFGSLATAGGLEQDPLGLFSGFLDEGLARFAKNFQMVSGVPVIEADEHYYAITRLHLQQSPFSVSFQQQALAELENAQSVTIQHSANAKFIRSGLLFHVIHGSHLAKQEISWMSTTSLCAILLIFILIFKSARPFFVTLMTMSFGALAGMAACLFFFGKIHLITLVFGTSLVGISVDYALHFFVQAYNKDIWSPSRTIGHIRNGLLLGLITSLFGFVGICIMPFPGLQQMAVFCAVGLTFACGCVLFWYPLLFRQTPKAPALWPYFLMKRYVEKLQPFFQHKHIATLLVGVSFIGLVALLFLPAKDDVRSMQPLSKALLLNDKNVATLTGTKIGQQFFLVVTDTIEENLQKQESLTKQLDAYKHEGKLLGYQSISQLVPSIKQQKINRELLRRFLKANQSQLISLYHSLGIGPTLLHDYATRVASEPFNYLELNQFPDASRRDLFASLWLGKILNKYVSIVQLYHITDRSLFKALEAKDGSIIFLDRSADISALLSRYRVTVSMCILASYLLIFIFLARYYNIKKAYYILMPTLFASVVALLSVVLCFGSYSLFNLMALFLVMGIGVDYTLFLTEAKSDYKPTMVALLLSAFTTVIAFGLLAFSETTVLRDFGITVAISITLTVLLSPIAISYAQKKGLVE